MSEARQEKSNRKLILAQETVRVLNAAGSDLGAQQAPSGTQKCTTQK